MGLGVLKTGVLSAATTLGATLLNKLLDNRTWTLLNQDTREAIKGQFPAEEPSFEYGANWGDIKSLNRPHPLLQYLQGQSDVFNVSSQFLHRDITDDSINEKINKLYSFCRRDQRFGRPPICRFAIGDGTVVNMEVILLKVSSVKYSQPDFLGGVRQVKFTLNFRRFTRFSLRDIPQSDTRFHRTASGQYYELIAQREYGDPLIGDYIRKQPEQSGKALLVPGDVVKLPAREGVKDKIITQTSVILKTAFGRTDTPQKLRLEERVVALSQPVDIFEFTAPSAPSRLVASDDTGLGSGGLGSAPLGSS
jgi:hypothetical protein